MNRLLNPHRVHAAAPSASSPSRTSAAPAVTPSVEHLTDLRGRRSGFGRVVDTLRRTRSPHLRERALRASTEANDVAAVQTLLDAGVDPTARSRGEESTAFIRATRPHIDLRILRAMLRQGSTAAGAGIEYNVQLPMRPLVMPDGELNQLLPGELNTALHEAVRLENVEAVREILRARSFLAPERIRLDIRNAYGQTPLGMAQAMNPRDAEGQPLRPDGEANEIEQLLLDPASASAGALPRYTPAVAAAQAPVDDITAAPPAYDATAAGG